MSMNPPIFRASTIAVLSSLALVAQCPIEISKVNPAETASWSQAGRALGNTKKQAIRPDFVVKLKNTSSKDIRGMKLLTAYYDATEDLHVIPEAWNSSNEVKAGLEKVLKWDDFQYAKTAFIGWVVIPTKVLFEDGTKWQYDESTKECYGEYWRDKKEAKY